NYISTLDNEVIVEKIDKALAEKDANRVEKIKPLFKSEKPKTKQYLLYALAASLAFFITFSIFIKQDRVPENITINASGNNDIFMGDSSIMVRTADGKVSLLDKKDSL